jgi:hypothetical protein
VCVCVCVCVQYLPVVNGVGLICAPGMILKQYLNILQVRSHVSVSLSVSLSLHISDLSLARALSLCDWTVIDGVQEDCSV